MKKKIFIIGSGWSSKGFLDKIDYNMYEIYIISNNEKFIYQPILANYLLNDDKIDFELSKKYPLIKFEKNEVIDFDFEKNQIITKFTQSTKNKNKYDYLILCHGSIINDFNIEGVKENSYYLKNNYDAEKIKESIHKLPPNSNIAIIGCGLTGSEIIGHLMDKKKYNIYAIDGLKAPLNIFNNKIQDYTIKLWEKNKINLHFGSFVKKMDDKQIYLHNNKKIKYDLSIWCGGIKIHPLSVLINKKLQMNNQYGIPVNTYLKIEKLKNVYALGDCAYSGNIPNAQVAYQQGTYLAHNFNNNMKNNKDFVYQNKGQMCYIGDKKAVYQNNNIDIKGSFAFLFMKVFKLYLKI